MAVLKRRDRIVVFRLTQDEYKRLQRACTRTGARNLSDFTRGQLLAGAWADRFEGRLSAFEKRMAELHAGVRQITRLLKQIAVRQITRLLKQIANSNSPNRRNRGGD